MSETHDYRAEMRTVIEDRLYDFLHKVSIDKAAFPDLVLRDFDQLLGCKPDAAPALLEACKAALHYISEFSNHNDRIVATKKLKAAIALAEKQD